MLPPRETGLCATATGDILDDRVKWREKRRTRGTYFEFQNDIAQSLGTIYHICNKVLICIHSST